MDQPLNLGEYFELFIEEQVKSGRYKDAEEVVRAALRLLEDQQFQDPVHVDAIRAAIAEAEADPTEYPAEEVFAELRARYRQLAEKDE